MQVCSGLIDIELIWSLVLMILRQLHSDKVELKYVKRQMEIRKWSSDTSSVRTWRSVRSKCYTSISNHMFGIQPWIIYRYRFKAVDHLVELQSMRVMFLLYFVFLIYQIWVLRHFLLSRLHAKFWPPSWRIQVQEISGLQNLGLLIWISIEKAIYHIVWTYETQSRPSSKLGLVSVNKHPLRRARCGIQISRALANAVKWARFCLTQQTHDLHPTSPITNPNLPLRMRGGHY